MNSLDIAFIVILIASAGLGYLFGFGKTLKWFSSGIVGIVIAAIACFMLGGAVQNFGFVQSFISNVNDAAAEAWSFLGYLKCGFIAFYVIMFVIIQILRITIVKIIKNVFESENSVVKIINKTLGVVFMTCFVLALMLLSLAGIEALQNTDFGHNMAEKFIDTEIVGKIFENNPITFLLDKT